MKKLIKIKFVDFNEGATAVKVLLQHLQDHYEVELSDSPDWLFYSVFGQEHLAYNDCVKIFFTGENQAPDFNLCDYAIGFEHLQFGDRYMRLPLWMIYPDDVQQMQAKHTSPDISAKTDFCSFVYSNSNAAPARQQFYDALSAYKHINSGGKYLNNVGGPVKDKLAFQSKHKFAIAFENTSHCGYTTEKLVQAFAAQTVPIYWGDPAIADTFDSGAFINCIDFPDWEAVVSRVREIDQDDNLWQQMLRTPALRDPEVVTKTIQQLDDFLQHIFNQEPSAAKRYSRDYWAVKQLRIRLREKRAYERSLFGIAHNFFNKHIYPSARRHPRAWALTQRMMQALKV